MPTPIEGQATTVGRAERCQRLEDSSISAPAWQEKQCRFPVSQIIITNGNAVRIRLSHHGLLCKYLPLPRRLNRVNLVEELVSRAFNQCASFGLVSTNIEYHRR